MHPKLPLSHGWKHRVRSSVLSDVILNLVDSPINVPFFLRPESLNQYTYGQGPRVSPCLRCASRAGLPISRVLPL